MKRPIKWGLILGVAVALQTLVFAAAAWQRIYSMAFVWLAIAIGLNVAAVVLCLRETAAERAWVGQLQAGLIVGLVASVLVFVSTWFVTGVLFPDYYLDMAEGYREAFTEMDMSQEAIDESVAGLATTSPVRSGFEGVAGTMVVSLLTAAIAGIWLRRRE